MYITAEGLTKRYVVRKARAGSIWRRDREIREALTEVSFQIDRGELVGLIGPNGAGKSTTVKLLTGILTPTAGTCEVDGLVPWRDRAAHVSRIGTVFGQRTQLWWDVPIAESYGLLRDIYRLEEGAFRRRLEELCAALELEPLLGIPLRQLSLGQRMRAELCASLLHTPPLLFLDEPSIGLDAVSKLSLRAFLLEENRQRGTTIVLTTHDMEDMRTLCSRAMVLGHGRLLYDGELNTLLKRYDTERTLECVFEGEISPEGLPDGMTLARDGDRVLLTFHPARLPMARALEAVSRMGTLREMTLREQHVDALIARMYQEMAL